MEGSRGRKRASGELPSRALSASGVTADIPATSAVGARVDEAAGRERRRGLVRTGQGHRYVEGGCP